jgi:hypothetical protein
MQSDARKLSSNNGNLVASGRLRDHHCPIFYRECKQHLARRREHQTCTDCHYRHERLRPNTWKRTRKEVSEKIWLVTFMNYDLGFFDEESARVECAENPFSAKVSPVSPAGIKRYPSTRN